MPDRLLIPDHDDHDHELARQVGRAELARRFLLGFLVIGTLAMLVIGTAGIVQIRATQVANRAALANTQAAAEATKHTASRVEDCTTPGGDCYERGLKGQADAVADINRVVILAAACSVGLPHSLTQREREVRIQACVINGLAAHASR